MDIIERFIPSFPTRRTSQLIQNFTNYRDSVLANLRIFVTFPSQYWDTYFKVGVGFAHPVTRNHRTLFWRDLGDQKTKTRTTGSPLGGPLVENP